MVVTESLAKGLAQKTIRELGDRLINSRQMEIDTKPLRQGFKKSKQTLKKQCETDSRFIFLDERNEGKSSWEVVWGSWGLCSDGEPETIDAMDRIAFNLSYFRKLDDSRGHFNIILTRHALIRLLMRSDRDLLTADDVLRYLKPITKDVVWAGLSILDGKHGTVVRTGEHYLPLAYSGNHPTFYIKTVLREDFDFRADKIIDTSKYRSSLFDYPMIFGGDYEYKSPSFKRILEMKSSSLAR